jgi:hypothetical protein
VAFLTVVLLHFNTIQYNSAVLPEFRNYWKQWPKLFKIIDWILMLLSNHIFLKFNIPCRWMFSLGWCSSVLGDFWNIWVAFIKHIWSHCYPSNAQHIYIWTSVSVRVSIKNLNVGWSQPGWPDEFVKKSPPKSNPAHILSKLISKC